MRNRISLFVGACCLLVACTPERQAASNAEDSAAPSENGGSTAEDGAPLVDVNELQLATAPAPQPGAGCPVKSVKWIAFVQPVNGVRKLVVAGLVTVSSSGWTLDLRPESPGVVRPVTQPFTLDATPPSGPVILPTLPRQVHKVIDAQQEYLAVVVKCGGEEIARITEIPEKEEYQTGPADVQTVEGNQS